MRKNTARHLLHALLDLLPVLTIPIFAIYITNHEPEPISITAETEQIVDFNQLMPLPSNDVFTVYSSGATANYDGTEITLNNATGRDGMYLKDAYRITLKKDHKYLFRYDYQTLNDINWSIGFSYIGNRYYSSFNYSNIMTTKETIFTFTEESRLLIDIFPNNTGQVGSVIINNMNIFDLTQMFGAGNEPTINQFNNYFPNDYYSYTISELVGINHTQVLYNDTDIGSQYIYQMYHVTDKYFNMGNVFNLGNVYEWFNVNIFYGQSPFVMNIVYNIIVYEFVMDLLFLLYGLFMWFVDMLKRLIEKPLNSIK